MLNLHKNQTPGQTFESVSNIDEKTKKVLYSYSKFPIILTDGYLLLGSNFNANNSMQLKDLCVKLILSVSTYPREKDATGKIMKTSVIEEETKLERVSEKRFNLKLNPQKVIDFDGIWEELLGISADKNPDQVTEKSNGGADEMSHKVPVLVCCQDGDLSACLAATFLMRFEKMDINKSTLVVMAKSGGGQLNSELYSHCMYYKPGNKIIKV